LYLTLAERHRFVCVGQFLTGYRLAPWTMSGDWRRMLGSFDAVMEPFVERNAEWTEAAREGRTSIIAWLLLRAIRSGRWADTAAIMAELFRHDRRIGLARGVRLPFNCAQLRLIEPMQRLAQTAGGRDRSFLKPPTRPDIGLRSA